MTESFWPLLTSFLNVLKRASLTGEKWWVSTNIPGSAPIMQFREESVVGHWIPSDLEKV